MIRRPPRSTLFPTRRSSDLPARRLRSGPAVTASRRGRRPTREGDVDRKSTRLNSSHSQISYAVFCLKKKKKIRNVVMCSGDSTDEFYVSVYLYSVSAHLIVF